MLQEILLLDDMVRRNEQFLEETVVGESMKLTMSQYLAKRGQFEEESDLPVATEAQKDEGYYQKLFHWAAYSLWYSAYPNEMAESEGWDYLLDPADTNDVDWSLVESVATSGPTTPEPAGTFIPARGTDFGVDGIIFPKDYGVVIDDHFKNYIRDLTDGTPGWLQYAMRNESDLEDVILEVGLEDSPATDLASWGLVDGDDEELMDSLMGQDITPELLAQLQIDSQDLASAWVESPHAGESMWEQVSWEIENLEDEGARLVTQKGDWFGYDVYKDSDGNAYMV